ncbi:hypothetical protein EN829_018100 [Mesorhizobium sp. M00.F.Ca.ET.186.01.1.1]|nr:hypothetical protein EN848_16435 [bacterium M00.F.Ca.ET.205.01.1.1]TGU46097.1 hypothetical protein EN795_32815 [bacterium M00.F.Ca.ET.152.01.1.1]TGV35134.1 hypothetical protein EN829_018100 [Mesorhizobium sp. M00.F.Ca.ET.186.01.1.1]TGZ43087.1 hypothetical protein EN805_13670 [bacterium M00.F.Ca.ET.162.01.1.1]TIW61958.1 MAG: hypothetical protein E5V48_07005 [Mesorhizobium sp.]
MNFRPLSEMTYPQSCFRAGYSNGSVSAKRSSTDGLSADFDLLGSVYPLFRADFEWEIAARVSSFSVVAYLFTFPDIWVSPLVMNIAAKVGTFALAMKASYSGGKYPLVGIECRYCIS